MRRSGSGPIRPDRRSWPDGVKAPGPRHALEPALAPIIELDTRADDQVLHGGGDEDLSGSGGGRNPLADVDGDAGDVIAPDFALTGVEAGADLDAKAASPLSD